MEIKLGKSSDYYRMKSDQEWEMAGLARQDGDTVDEARHTAAAREFARLARESK
jgi:hypothetical protein